MKMMKQMACAALVAAVAVGITGCGDKASSTGRFEPKVAEGAFAMTNQIVSAVSEVSSGKALVVPLRFEERNRYCEMVFTWKPSPDCAEDRELVVRGYVNGKRQMAVCCCLHTKGDGIKADFAMP